MGCMHGMWRQVRLATSQLTSCVPCSSTSEPPERESLGVFHEQGVLERELPDIQQVGVSATLPLSNMHDSH